MGAAEFGRLMGRAMAEQGISQNRLASRLGELPDGRIFDATQIRLIREGRRRLDHELVRRLIDLLNLDEAEAWATSGLWPPDLDLDGYRRFREHAMAANRLTVEEPRGRALSPTRMLPVDPAVPSLLERIQRARPPVRELEGVAA